ncbi:MAG: hypothetical protein WCC86_09640 [Methanoregula sp.]|jgi:hypothetical protein|uniref:hypothetical protein n=1 Tax=Methanoregula sp. TaxID=2052170 RepID=UPI003BB01C96
MRNAGLFLGFVPLIVYGILAGSSVSSVLYALVAATITIVAVGWNDLRKGRILIWANLVLFGSAFIAIGVLEMAWFIPYMGVLIYAVLAVVTLGSILAGVPFTLQYAREMVDKKLWENPFFIRINVLITGVWTGVFLVNFGLNVIMLVIAGTPRGILQVTTYVVLIGGIIFTLWYPEHIRKRDATISIHNPA